MQALENSPKAGGTPTRTREEHPRFVRILTKRFNSLNKVVRILTKSTLVLVTEVLRLVLPIRSHPINPIRSSPAGGGPGFFRDGRHTSGHGSESGRAARAVRGRCGRLRAALWRLRDALPGSTGNGFVSGALLPLVASRAVCVGRIYSGLWRNYG